MQENEPHRGQLALSDADGFWTPTVWSLAKGELANSCPRTVDELMEDVIRSVNDIRGSRKKLHGCILQSELPLFLR